MMAPPKAISQGSNGAGGGAFSAFIGISAAKAEPVTASIAATKTIFFMSIPITFPRTNLERVDGAVKQKSEASAEKLSVMTILGMVVSRCCIPTTILTRFCQCCGHDWDRPASKNDGVQRPQRIATSG